MARRTPSSRPTHCPACDARLDTDMARQPSPSCPACGQSLAPVRAAGFWRRAAATVVDTAMLMVTAGLLNWALLRLLGLPPLTGESTGLDKLLRIAELEPTAVAARIAPFLAMAALYVGLFWGLMGRTLGQRLLRLRVVDAHGRSPSPMWVTVRIVGMGLGLLAGGLGWLWAAFDLEKRAWHDHLARTYVVMDNTGRLASGRTATPKARVDLSRNGGSSSNDTERATKARSPRASLRRHGQYRPSSVGADGHAKGSRRPFSQWRLQLQRYRAGDPRHDNLARTYVTPTERSSAGTIDSLAPTS